MRRALYVSLLLLGHVARADVTVIYSAGIFTGAIGTRAQANLICSQHSNSSQCANTKAFLGYAGEGTIFTNFPGVDVSHGVFAGEDTQLSPGWDGNLLYADFSKNFGPYWSGFTSVGGIDATKNCNGWTSGSLVDTGRSGRIRISQYVSLCAARRALLCVCGNKATSSPTVFPSRAPSLPTRTPSKGPSWSPSRGPAAPLSGNFKLVGSGSVGATSNFGWSVAYSADGSTIAIGGYSDNSYRGAVWIYALSLETGFFVQQGPKLVANDTSGSSPNQGMSVALSADGNTVAFGGPNDNNLIGGTWVFIRTGLVWRQQSLKLIGTGAAGSARQGESIAISADGNTLAVGGAYDDNYLGAVWIFIRNTGTQAWTQLDNKLIGTGYTRSPAYGMVFQGGSVSLNAAGTLLAVGGRLDADTGAVWLFVYYEGYWSQQGSKIVGTGAVGTYGGQGTAVALSPTSGAVLAFSAQNDNGGVGAVYVFALTNDVWVQQGSKLVGVGTSQARSVSFTADGTQLLVGSPVSNGAIGGVYIYIPAAPGATWTVFGGLRVGADYIGVSQQGTSVAMGPLGNSFVECGNSDNNNRGACWVFQARTTRSPTPLPTKSPSRPTTNTPSHAPTFFPTVDILYMDPYTVNGAGTTAAAHTRCSSLAPSVTASGFVSTCTNPRPVLSESSGVDLNALFSTRALYSNTGVRIALNGNQFLYGTLDNTLEAAGLCGGVYWTFSGQLGYVDTTYGCFVNPNTFATTSGSGMVGSCLTTAATVAFSATIEPCFASHQIMCICTGARTTTSPTSAAPTTGEPSVSPTTSIPSTSPSSTAPTVSPTTTKPTGAPSTTPSRAPTPPTPPTTHSPTLPTPAPTSLPSLVPSRTPSKTPTTSIPTKVPSRTPTTSTPTGSPTIATAVNLLYPAGINVNGAYTHAAANSACVTAAPSVPGAIWAACANPQAFVSNFDATFYLYDLLGDKPVYSKSGVRIAKSKTDFRDGPIDNTFNTAGLCTGSYWTLAPINNIFEMCLASSSGYHSFIAADVSFVGTIGSCTSTSSLQWYRIGTATCNNAQALLCLCDGTRVTTKSPTASG